MNNQRIATYIKAQCSEPAQCDTRCAVVCLKQGSKLPNSKAFALRELQAKEITQTLKQMLEEQKGNLLL